MGKWIRCGLRYGPLYEGASSCTEEKTFCGEGLNLPGTLIRLDNGDEYLIGDISVNRGIGEPFAFEKDSIVLEYKSIGW